MSAPDNPRAVAGDNVAPDYARRVTEQMERDYAALIESIDALLAKARTAVDDGSGKMKTVTADDDAVALGAIVKELRDADSRAEAFRIAEKEPHLRGGQAVDAFFFALRDKVAKRDRKAKPGAADVLQGLIDDFLERKRIEEEARRRREAQEAERLAREAREKAEREAREAEEKRLAAERARKPENIAARTEEAQEAEAAAATAAVEADLAASKAEEAHVATLAKPAEMARTRGDGVLLTQKREPYAIVVDRTKLDKEALWVFLTDDAIEKALRAWARTTGHSKQMEGAEIGFGRKGVTR